MVDTTYLDSVETRGDAPGPGAFRGGAATGVAYARFGQGFDSVSSYAQGADGGRYTVNAGDTLSGIALQLWGDASLWYKLAQANGLTADSALIEGQTLTVPAGVIRTGNNASTVRPYDPSDAYGNTSPTTPKPIPPKVAAHKNKCGVFGAILLVAVAVAVAAVTTGAGAMLFGNATSILGGISSVAAGTAGLSVGASIGIGVAAGALGSIASQGVGVATGIQEAFSWKAVALAGIAGGIGGAIGGGNILGKVGGKFTTAFANGAARGVLANIATQGVAVATGLQGKFDWAGVAVGGVVGGTVAGVGQQLHVQWQGTGLGDRLGQTAAGAAGAIAGAAARGLLTGTDFGDNIMATLPDVIGSTIGNVIASRLASPKLSVDMNDPSMMDTIVTGGGAGGLTGGSRYGGLSLSAGGGGAYMTLNGLKPRMSGELASALNPTYNYIGEGIVNGVVDGYNYVVGEARAGLNWLVESAGDLGADVVVTARTLGSSVEKALTDSGAYVLANRITITINEVVAVNRQYYSNAFDMTLGGRSAYGRHVARPTARALSYVFGPIADSPLSDPGAWMSIEAAVPGGRVIEGIGVPLRAGLRAFAPAARIGPRLAPVVDGGVPLATAGTGVPTNGLAFELKYLDRHIEGTAQANRMLRKGEAVHVFETKTAAGDVAQAIIERGRYTGTRGGFDRYGLQFEAPIGYRIAPDGSRVPLSYGQLKVRTDGMYHVIARTGPGQ